MEEMTGDSESEGGGEGGGGALRHIYMKPAIKIRAISDHDMLSKPDLVLARPQRHFRTGYPLASEFPPSVKASGPPGPKYRRPKMVVSIILRRLFSISKKLPCASFQPVT